MIGLGFLVKFEITICLEHFHSLIFWRQMDAFVSLKVNRLQHYS